MLVSIIIIEFIINLIS